ncbi:MAG: hypothetical protein US52_C0028G0004 [candidate division WS6 bacterium GW2011_GWA2_37_6]|uniref:DUF6438 domain-containing protein n=1 Tax=candidate division WS6 bacterium GW2011_GWA2_37_6 TaxID=1619087 RepID=A0A0G0K3W4_9BACT|nr:MAG: hypothetical protein US52_C0028G0004 [candidate division WS6 bacterium GW2011_GWA2_37_6]
MNKKLIAAIAISFILVLLLIPIYFLYTNFQDDPKGNGSFTYIKMSRTACYGTCPAYSVEIESNGDVKYIGEMFVGVKGERTFELTESQVQELNDAIKEADFFSLKDRYYESVTDLPSTTTLIRTTDEEKSIYNYVGAPNKLNVLEDKIDEITGVDSLIECDEQCAQEA